MADKLEEFRKKWLKELKQQKHGEQDADADNKTENDLSTDGQDKRTVGNDALGNPPLVYEAGQYVDVAALQEDQKVDAINVNDIQRYVCDDENETSATYYPFRILTTLLNRASTEEGPSRKRRSKSSSSLSKSEAQNAPVTPKRTYFSTSKTDSESAEAGSSKKVKTELLDKRKEKGYLDLFIADLDEISEIPFFDVSLPREVAINIFQHLSVKDLCSCAQVSKSWRSLAEDELLWCRICHEHGFEKDTLTVESENWKSRVRQYSIIKHTLEQNWKNRTGKLYNLHHAKGGVLCDAYSFKSTVVAGYSNCQTKLWDVTSGETCIFQPSSTALMIDEAEEEGTINNEVLHVTTCSSVTAATYSHGFVDVWSNEEGTEPLYTVHCEGNGNSRRPTSLQLMETAQATYLGFSHGPTVQIHKLHGGEGRLKDTVVFDSPIKSTLWLQPADKSVVPSLTPTLAVATDYTVSVIASYEREHGCSYELLELHNIVDAPVTCVDARLEPSEVVVGYTLNTGPSQFFQTCVYDITTRQTKHTLTGHTACVLCVNMAESPTHQLVTGSRDRKVRVYDTRYPPFSIMTLIGHSAAVTTVQMDDGKVVSGDEAGFVRVWDQRMARKLWEMNNRHPVRYCHFSGRELVLAHVPYVKHHHNLYDYDTGLHQRHRGSLHVYDFLADQKREGVPEICLSSYDEPQGYNYNISLAVPYDQL